MPEDNDHHEEDIGDGLMFLDMLFGPPHVDPKGTHKHKCPKCGTIWEHANDCGALPGDTPEDTLVKFEEQKFDKAHECPKCGVETTLKYKGDDEAQFHGGSCRAPGPIEYDVAGGGKLRVTRPPIKRPRRVYRGDHHTKGEK